MSVCAINRIKEYEETIKELKIERDYYKERYSEFNEAFIQQGEKLCK